jgi:integrase
MATTRFFLQSKSNPANIYISLSIKAGMVFKRKTGYVIDPNDWSEDTNLPKQNDDNLKNLKTDLKKLSNTIEENLNKLTATGMDPSGDWLQQHIDLAHGKRKTTDEDRLTNYLQNYIDDLPYKEYPSGKCGATRPTISKYNTLKIKIQNFEQYKKKTYYLKDVTPAFRNELVKYFREVDHLGANTTGRYVKFLKTVCLDADSNGFEVSKQLKQVKGFTEKAVKIFLNFDELEKIEKAKFTRTALDNARDWLIIGCYIGQRVGDLLNLTKANIVTRAGLELIELTQQKTGKSVSIPLHSKVKEILDRHNGNFPDTISDQKFNKHIKDLCKLAGINQQTTGGIVDKETKRKQNGTFPKWQLVTSHICRRSFASNFYGEIPTALLINITAHSTEQQFLAYIGKTTNDYAIQLAEHWQKEVLRNKKESVMQVLKQVN